MRPGEGWRGTEKRRYARVSVSLPAALLLYRQRLAVRLIDFSRGGAMGKVEDGVAPARGDEVVLALEKLEVVATVAWENDGSFGLAFHRPLEGWQIPSAIDL